jgi:3-dehydroquinate dehydratase-2
MKKVLIINGPNLNLLGKREPEVYGSKTFDEFLGELKQQFSNVELDYFQSNHEGEIIDKLHQVGFNIDAIIMNPGAFTHTSVAIRDAIAGIETPVYEVHISNTHSREEFRKKSHVSPVAAGVIIGFGLDSYRLALHAVSQR